MKNEWHNIEETNDTVGTWNDLQNSHGTDLIWFDLLFIEILLFPVQLISQIARMTISLLQLNRAIDIVKCV